MLIEEFSSAFETYLNRLVELEYCIKNVESERKIFDDVYFENEVSLFGKIISRQ